MNDTTDHPNFPEPEEQVIIKCSECGRRVDINDTIEGVCASHLTEEDAEYYHHTQPYTPETMAEHILWHSLQRFTEHYLVPFDLKLLRAMAEDTKDALDLLNEQNELFETLRDEL